jgi:DNA polymerase-3 subunit beta
VLQVKFRANSKEIAAAVRWAASSAASADILSGVLIEERAGVIVVSAYNQNTTTKQTVTADIQAGGRAVIPAKMLTGFLGSLTGETVEITIGDAHADIVSDEDFQVEILPAADYPATPMLPPITGTVDAALLSEALKQVLPTVSREANQGSFNAVLIEARGDKLTIVTCDKVRLASREIPWQPVNPDVNQTVLVPREGLETVAGAYRTGTVSLALSDDPTATFVGMVCDTRAMITHQHTAQIGVLADWRKILPTGLVATAAFNAKMLRERLTQANLVLSETSDSVLMTFTGNGEVSLLGQVKDTPRRYNKTIPVEYTGEPIAIRFYPAQLISGIDAVGSETVVLGLKHPLSPAMVTSEPVNPDEDKQPDFRFMLTPTKG